MGAYCVSAMLLSTGFSNSKVTAEVLSTCISLSPVSAFRRMTGCMVCGVTFHEGANSGSDNSGRESRFQ